MGDVCGFALCSAKFKQVRRVVMRCSGCPWALGFPWISDFGCKAAGALLEVISLGLGLSEDPHEDLR